MLGVLLATSLEIGVVAMAWPAAFVDKLTWRLRAFGAPKVSWQHVHIYLRFQFRYQPFIICLMCIPGEKN